MANFIQAIVHISNLSSYQVGKEKNICSIEPGLGDTLRGDFFAGITRRPVLCDLSWF